MDVDKCIACGICASKCPVKVADQYNEGMNVRKAAYIEYSQALPLKYALDEENCIYLLKGKCRACEKFCPADAINFEDRSQEFSLNVGAIILAMGYATYRPIAPDTYFYKQHPNVLTSMEFERMLSSSGPTGGRLLKPSDNTEPASIAWIQCVGSRSVHEGAKPYCSALCCTQAVKEASLAKEHVQGLDAAVFFIDIRTQGKYYERYYVRAKNEAGVRFIKSRIPSFYPISGTDRLLITYTNDKGALQKEEFEMVVLSVGMGVDERALELSRRLGVELDEFNFPATSSLGPVRTSVPGILVCGAMESPKDITSSVVEASAAAGSAGSILADTRWSATVEKEEPEQIDVSGLPPRIGLFVCRCGTNIAGVVDVPGIVGEFMGKGYVVHAEECLFACSQDTQKHMADVIRKNDLNRVVVAACTPRTHELLFQETINNAGLNKHLLEMANIRNHCSWVHAENPDLATVKAKDLVRMALSKASHLKPLFEQKLAISQEVLVIGGGMAGMAAALVLAEQGFRTYIVEKDQELGGQARFFGRTWKGENVQKSLNELLRAVMANDNISIYLNSELKDVDGSVGRFQSRVLTHNGEFIIRHGAVIIATGALEHKPYLNGVNRRIITGLELERRLIDPVESLKQIGKAVFVLCVGSRIPERPYCSKFCCTQSIGNSLRLLDVNPNMEIYIIYRDIRTYGKRELLYTQARRAGVHFIRYDENEGLAVEEAGPKLELTFTDLVLRRKLSIPADLVVLATAIVPPGNRELARMFKIPLNDDGFFLEAHVKLRPVDFAADGVFVCGLAQGPKPIEESIAQAQAAAARVATILSSSTLTVGGITAEIDVNRCTGCSVCVAICPYYAISLKEDNTPVIDEVICKGCGLCSASCRSGAASLKGYSNSEVFSQIASAFG